MPEAERISVEEARRKVQSGEAILVCGYADEEKCRRMMLDGAITLQDLEQRLSSLPRDQEIIFYCA